MKNHLLALIKANSVLTEINAAYYPSGVGKSQPACLAGDTVGNVHLCRWQVTLADDTT